MIRKPQQEVGGKAIRIPPHLLIQPLGRYAVQSRQVGIQQNAPAADHPEALPVRVAPGFRDSTDIRGESDWP